MHFKCPRIRDTDPENKVSNRASPRPPNLCTHRYVWHYAALRCVDIRTARLHNFLPDDLVVFSIESLGSGAPLQLLKSAYGDRQAPASGPRLFVLSANRIPPLRSQFSFVRTGNLETQDSLACPFQMSVMSFYTAA